MNKGQAHRPKRVRGFTLIEIMVVIVIIGLIAGIVAPAIIGQLNRAQGTAAVADIDGISAALDLFYLDFGRYPTQDEGLDVLLGGDEVNGRTVREFISSLRDDPWGNAYVYEIPSTHGDRYDVFTYGADGEEGGEDENADIGTWNLDEQR